MGLLVEPNPDFHEALISKHRNAWILPHCLSTKTTPIIVNFFADLLTGGIISKNNKLFYSFWLRSTSLSLAMSQV